MRVYADLFFLLNAGADYALLAAAGRLTGLRAPVWRLLAAATVGGLYGVAALLTDAPRLFSLPASAAVAALMAVLAFAPRPALVFVRLLACLYGAAALAAGLVMGLAARVGWSGIPLWSLLVALGLALVAGGALYERWRPGSTLQSLCDLEIEVGGRVARCRALLDTGNALCDPAGAVPAVVVAPEVLRGVVPARLLAALASGPEALPGGLGAAALHGGAAFLEASAALEAGPHDPGAADGPEADWARRVRLLPYRALGTPGGMLCGLRPDAIRLGRGWARHPVRAVIAVSPTALDPTGAFAALIPACLTAAQPLAEVAGPSAAEGHT